MPRKYYVRMIIVGIDPGISGAVAVLRKDGTAFRVLKVYDIPCLVERRASGKIRRSIDPKGLESIIKEIQKTYGPISHSISEKLTAAPLAGSLACFSMGFSSGVIKTVFDLLGIPLAFVYPHKWKHSLNIPAHKEAARLAATKLFKSDAHWKNKKDHNRAEASLIAAYCGLVV